MNNIRKLLYIISLLTLTLLLFTGCSFTPEDTPERTFIISGKFTKNGIAGSGDVFFKLANKGNYSRSPEGPNRVITYESYSIEGELQDNGLTIKLKGSYDPFEMQYTVSADTSTLRYVINGFLNSNGNFKEATATVLVKTGDNWPVLDFSVASETVTITGTAIDSDNIGIPDFALGLWRRNSSFFFSGLTYIVSPFSYILNETISYDDYVDYYTFYQTIVKVVDKTGYYDFIVAYSVGATTKYEKYKVEFSKGNSRMIIVSYLNGNKLDFNTIAAAEATTSLDTNPFRIQTLSR
ncbi:MAG: hypothetical protein FWE72_04925 [Spirochaetaceae bacterium]|nr:hypothetical protein [Spirochaetaceae bacterium]